MSSLLEQAIVDATALKEAATKNAEKNLIDKYSHKIKEAVDKLLEQDLSTMDQNQNPQDVQDDSSDGMDAASSLENIPSDLSQENPEEAPKAKKDPLEKIKSSFMLDGKDDELITIDFSSLKVKPVQDMAGSPQGVAPNMAPPASPLPSTSAPAPTPSAPAPTAPIQESYEYEELEEELEGSSSDYGDDAPVDEQVEISLEEEMCEGEGCGDDMNTEPTGVLVQVDEDGTYGDDEAEPQSLEEFELEESLIVDMEGVSDGYRGLQPNDRRELENIKLARMQDEEMQLKIREYEDAVEQANKKVRKASKEKEVLVKENEDLKETLLSLKEHIEKMNISNAKLLYMNRVLGNNSFNERQKEQIVETISRTDSVEGAKIAFETLQSSVQSVKREINTPKSLNEAVSRSSSPFLVRKTKENNPFSERMKVLAGIKN